MNLLAKGIQEMAILSQQMQQSILKEEQKLKISKQNTQEKLNITFINPK